MNTNQTMNCCLLFLHIVPSRLTSTNIALLVLGVVLWCVTLVGLGVVMIMMRFKLNKGMV